MNRRGRARGFTLVEVMVATVIFLIFISAVYGAYRAANLATLAAEEQADLYQTGRVLLAQLNTELTSAYQAADAQTSELIGEDATDETGTLPADHVAFLTTAHATDRRQTVGGLCRVNYLMGGEQEDEKPGLYVEEYLHPGLETADEQPIRRLVSPLVIGINCKYLPADGDWLTEWVDQTTLPRAVRVELTLQAPRAGAKPLVLVTTANPAMATAPAAAEESDVAQP